MSDIFSFLLDHWMLSLAFVVILALIIMNEFKRKLLGFKDLNPNDAVQLINKRDALVVDVRDENEYKQGHIINAVHMPVALMESRLAELEGHGDRPILLYCRTGQRSATAGALLNKRGFKDVFKLGGGMLAWESANMPVEKG